MKRTYEWRVEKGEVIRVNEIIGGKHKFPIHDVRIWDDVQLTDVTYKEGLSVSGGGATLWKEFHHGTVWVWREQQIGGVQ